MQLNSVRATKLQNSKFELRATKCRATETIEGAFVLPSTAFRTAQSIG
jgi:hypothetical protein